jgi:hypothetical protein
VLAALARNGDALPQITHISQATISIEGNNTWEMMTAFGVITSAGADEDANEEGTEAEAHALAVALAEIILMPEFAAAIAEFATQYSPVYFELASPFQPMAAAEVEAPGTMIFRQALSVRCHLQF